MIFDSDVPRQDRLQFTQDISILAIKYINKTNAEKIDILTNVAYIQKIVYHLTFDSSRNALCINSKPANVQYRIAFRGLILQTRN